MSWPSYTGPGPTTVSTVGDSIAVLTYEELEAAFTADPYQHNFAAWGGLSTFQMKDNGWFAAAAISEHVVIIGGTNNCYFADAYWSGLAQLGHQGDILNTLANRHVHWVNTYNGCPNHPGVDYQYHSRGWNSGLEYWAGQRPNLHIVGWNSAVPFFSSYGAVMLQPDGIHPTQEGQNILRNLIVGSVAAYS